VKGLNYGRGFVIYKNEEAVRKAVNGESSKLDI
jgi:hypothetical protein